MKRYIEIVYDNSGSMTDRVGNKKKYEIAQELFEKDILPSIGLRGDQVVLRLLRNGCEDSKSFPETLPNQRNLMLNRIKGINHDQSTPLFYTVFDSVEACRNIRADEYLIFVLTDGDDTCGVRIEDLIEGDIEAILVFLRNTAFGPEVNMTLNDPGTGKQFKTSVLIDQLSIINGQQPSEDGTFIVNLPRSGATVKVKPLTYGEILEIQKLADTYPQGRTAPKVTWRLNKEIVEINGTTGTTGTV
jgi:hypothetical protein